MEQPRRTKPVEVPVAIYSLLASLIFFILLRSTRRLFPIYVVRIPIIFDAHDAAGYALVDVEVCEYVSIAVVNVDGWVELLFGSRQVES